ncbi:YqjF family protein [Kordia sp.]|uniref:YqjF family protein n=1 Tax=Kordia sp. TaxID=1965332 RepID=UPI003B5B7BB1
MSFLTAEWRKLIFINYTVHPKLLEEYVPKGTELDIWEGKCLVSIVGFMFKNTKVLGCKMPSLHTFEEVNLRFYVKRKEGNIWKRGTVFIQEIVPKRILSFVANTVYNEHYITLPMSHNWHMTPKSIEVLYTWHNKRIKQSISVKAENNPKMLPENSEIEFITEHYFGYTKYDDSKTFEYEVTHPKWLYYAVDYYNVQIDFELNYGKKFAHLTKQQPDSVFLMEGSAITVEPKKSITKF